MQNAELWYPQADGFYYAPPKEIVWTGVLDGPCANTQNCAERLPRRKRLAMTTKTADSGERRKKTADFGKGRKV